MGNRDEAAYVFNPAGFDPLRFLPAGLSRHAEFARFFVHKVVWGSVFNHVHRNEFVPLMATHLRRFMGKTRDYKAVRDGLIGSGAIMCDGNYEVGDKAFGYRIGPEFEGRRNEMVKVMSRTLSRKILADRADQMVAPEPVHRHLLDYLRCMEIDAGAAIRFARGNFGFDPTAETAVRFIDGRMFRFLVCPYGRVHTNLTNLQGYRPDYCGNML